MMSTNFLEYEPIGLWWTVDAPSLRVPDPSHQYVSIWSAGVDGPSILLVPSEGRDHAMWEQVLPELSAHFTVHAMDARTDTSTTGDGSGVRTAADAVGAYILVALGDAAESVLSAAEPDDVVVLVKPPKPTGNGAISSTAARQVRTVDSGGESGAERLLGALRAVVGDGGPARHLEKGKPYDPAR